MKLVNIKTMKVRDLSEYETHKLINESNNKLEPRKYELLRTKDMILYQKNKRKKTKDKIKIMRLLALLAKEYHTEMLYNPKTNIATPYNGIKIFIIIADKVNTQDELEFHKNKIFYENYKNRVISLTKTKMCEYFELDYKTINDYYSKYQFPEFFKKYIKMRHFRQMLVSGRFSFNSRRYNDSSKRSADEKYVHDILQFKDTAKCYFSLSRVLDSKLEQRGQGFHIDMFYLVMDIDGDCKDKGHLINEYGYCINCMDNAKEKYMKFEKQASKIKGLKILKKVFSGSKGYHIHCEFNGKREISEQEMIYLINKINEKEELIDSFMFLQNSKLKFDKSRIFKVLNTIDSTTACLVSEKIERLNVKDKIVKPKG